MKREIFHSVFRVIGVTWLPVVLLLAGCATVPSPERMETAGEAHTLLKMANIEADRTQYGASTSAVRRYVRRWQRHYRREIAPRREDILDAGSGNWGAGFRLLLEDFYEPDFFRETAAILHNALLEETAPRPRARLESLIARHDLAVLTYWTLVYEKRATSDQDWLEDAGDARARLNARTGNDSHVAAPGGEASTEGEDAP